MINEGLIKNKDIKVRNIEIEDAPKTINKILMDKKVITEKRVEKYKFTCISDSYPNSNSFEIETKDFILEDCFITEYINNRLKGYCLLKRRK
jgi:hypothetical protein